MDQNKKKNQNRKRRHLRLRNKISGTASCPRLVVSRSLRNISAQVVDDTAGMTIVSATSNSKAFGQPGGNIAAAKVVGEMIAKAAQEKSITKVVFDRGGRKFHGRIKALADAAREGGLKF